MKSNVSPVIYWIPRVLSLAFVAFLMLFSLDVFDEGLGFWGTLLGLFMHNLPALILLIVVLVSWKHELVGAVAFIAAGFLYILLTTIRGGIPWYIVLSWSANIAGPAFLIGALYFVGWRKKRKDVTPSSSVTKDTNTRSAG